MTGRSSIQRQSEPLHRFFEDAFRERVNRSPQTLTALGIDARQDELDDLSEAGFEADQALIHDQLKRLARFDVASLTPADRLNRRMFEHDAKAALLRGRYRHNEYLINQKFGLHTGFPAFMISMHAIEDLADARNYIARMHAVDEAFTQVIDGLDKREAMGVVPPVFLFPQIIGDCRDFIGEQTAASDAVEQNVLYQDFVAKLQSLDGLPPDERDALLQGVKQALQEVVIPAYVRLITYLERQESRAPAEAGAWALPNGGDFYRACLEWHTSTSLNAEQIQAFGEKEVERLQREMLALRERVGVRGGLQDLFAFARDNPDFYYPQSSEGRQTYLDDLNAMIGHVETRLPELFTVFPQDKLQVKAVERHREKTAGLAFYEGPAADGSRPGVFYVNLYDMRQLPTYTMEALAYHEALPGHHMQFAIANRLQDLPTFRRYADHTAYVEGWGMYSELITREMGLYQDPMSNFGRLAQELKRACRLVVDTGIHVRRWTREQAIDYLHHNQPSPRAQLVKEVDRYIVMPGQATSYTVGMAEILKLRKALRAELGDLFDLRQFHDELLRHGPVPLALLEELMRAWGREAKASANNPDLTA